MKHLCSIQSMLIATLVFSTLSMTQLLAQIPTDGLVLYYPFNGNSIDASGNCNNGTAHGASLTMDRHGNPNNAYGFDGVDDYFEVEDIELDLDNEIGISFWMNVEDVNTYYRADPFVLTYIDCEGQELNLIRLRSYGTNRGAQPRLHFPAFIWDFYEDNSVVSQNRIDLNFSNRGWTHVVVTTDGNNLRLYIDGSLVKTVAYNLSTLVPADATDVKLGLPALVPANPGTNTFYHGAIDDVRVYNRSLSSSEVTELFGENSAGPGTPGSCLWMESGDNLYHDNKVSIASNTFPTTVGGDDISDYKLFVNGGILAKEVRVRTDWADYVFDSDYQLPKLTEVEAFINQFGHLPNVPSSNTIQATGMELGEITKIQQEKIEELTLYLIQQNKRVEALEETFESLISKE